MTAFVKAIEAAGHEVIVVCEQPNHPSGVFQAGYGRSLVRRERGEHVTVNRLWVMTSPQKTTLSRLMFYASFAVGAFVATAAVRSCDVALITSPPLPGAFAAELAARLRGVPVVLDVRDLWPAAAEALGELSNRRVIAAFERIERWMYGNAAAVTTTTRPFCRYIDARAGRPITTAIPNGGLDALAMLPRRSAPPAPPFRIGYFGNFGIAQGLGIVLDAAETLRDEPIEFLLTGAGPLELELSQRAQSLGLSNVVFRPSVDADRVGESLLSCHALLVPLRNHPLLDDFIPSKLYDAMAVGRPAIVAARGEAADFVAEHGFGVVVEPEDGRGLASVARMLANDRELTDRLGAAGKAAAGDHVRSARAARMCQLLETAATGTV